MSRRKIIMMMAGLVFILAIGAWAAASGMLVDQKSVLTGQVHAVVGPGSTVREGDVLVVVNTMVGQAPAVRATVDGVVREILIKPGATVRQGEVAVRIEPVRK